MDSGTIALIATTALTLLGILGVLAGIIKISGKVKETVDVIYAVVVAISDGKITADEVEKIKQEIKEAGDAWKSK